MSALFDFEVDALEVPSGLHLVAGLSGFTDAGGVLNQFAEHVFANLESQQLIRFSNDELLDYRSRRPIMYFEKDHIEDYEPANLGIYLVFDEANQPFLFLHGYEPDFRWDAFTDAVVQLVRRLGVRAVTWLHAIPFPIPHTREIGVTVSGNRKDLISEFSEWKPQTQVPGNVLHLLEYKLSSQGFPIAGFVLLCPHYLADNDFPQAAVSAFELVSSSTALVFPTDELRDEGHQFLVKLNEQVAENPELQKMIQTLEQGYQNEVMGPSRAPIVRPRVKLPTADEIAAELEGYLASRRRNNPESE
jgi:predicted ATP-grasp superfamily ATP-dependent carboligase